VMAMAFLLIGASGYSALFGQKTTP
jgi:hypothetical protein